MDSAAPQAIYQYSWLIPALPLASFLINGLWLGRRSVRASSALAVLLNLASAVYAVALAARFFTAGGPPVAWSYEWLAIAVGRGGPNLSVSMGGLLDPISVMMLVVISTVSALVHFYSIGYMRGDPGAGRFFPLLSFFAFSMLGLVIATNLVQLYVFWELVGVSSYLLIGFWYTKPSAVAACKKAFVVTRFADAFFLVGIVLVGYVNGQFDFASVNSRHCAALLNRDVLVGGLTLNLLTVATLLIFMGGWGKSAMFPLHIWLPDAMEGPTPVSAIIHSATMVVAGVYLTARMYPLFAAAPGTLHVVEAVGAAVIACTQKDIKRILAYSTLSQLGYMMFALGTARLALPSGPEVNGLGYSAAMFHVFTHASFKAMLFLAAGALIHAVHDNDLTAMGGLRRAMPFTYAAALVGCLAIAGVWPFSGFFSKDEILLTAWQCGHRLTFALGMATSALTAFYMFRFFFLIFHGEPKRDLSHTHEDFFMTLPIVLLAIPSAASGWIARHFFSERVVPSVFVGVAEGAPAAWLPYAAMAMGLAGIVAAAVLYGRGATAESLLAERHPLYRLVRNKFYIDEVWLFVTRRVVFALVAEPARWFDARVVDGSMNATAWVLQKGGAVQRAIQNGQVQLYLGAIVTGLILLYGLAGGLP